MNEYEIRWEIQVSADSKQEAARMALDIQRDPTSLATLFEVRIFNNPKDKWEFIDVLNRVKVERVPDGN